MLPVGAARTKPSPKLYFSQLSRYMLAAKFTANDTSPFLYGDPDEGVTTFATISDFKFAGEYTPVANLTTFCVDVSSNVQIDWVAMLTYSRCNFNLDLGYELWYRGCEKFNNDCETASLITENTWALKGDAYVYGFAAAANANLPIALNQPVALGGTESNATVYQGATIDNQEFAVAGNQAATQFVLLNNSATPDTQALTSIQSIFLSSDNINVCNASRGFSNKIFAHVSYSWDCECWQPYFGGGAMGEFGPGSGCKKSCNTPTTTTTDCDSTYRCTNSAFSQWGIWLKGGFVF